MNIFCLKRITVSVVLAAIASTSLAGTTNDTVIHEIAPMRFRVAEVTRQGPPVNGEQITILRLAPFIHKSQDLAEARSKFETPDIRLVTLVDAGYEIRTNDWFNLQAVRLPEPGSIILPSSSTNGAASARPK